MRTVFYLIGAILTLGACQNAAPETSEDPVRQERALLQDSIETMEQSMRQEESLDAELADKMIRSYFAFARLVPQDSLSPEYLMKAADIFKLGGGAAQKQALSIYARILRDYQEHPAAPRALFSAALLREAQGNRALAQADYQRFVELYPEHTLAGDARNMLSFLAEEEETDLSRVKRWMKENEQKEGL